MKHLYITLLLSGCFLFGNGQQVTFVSTLFLNTTTTPDYEITIQIGLSVTNDGNGQCHSIDIASFIFEMHWSNNVTLVSGSDVYFSKGASLNDPGYINAIGEDANSVQGSYVHTVTNNPNKTFNTIKYTRSTDQCANLIHVDCGQLIPLFTAKFRISPTIASNYCYVWNGCTPDNSKYIAQYIGSVSDPLDGPDKEIVFVIDKTKSLFDKSGNKCNGTIVNTNVLTNSSGNSTFTNTYGAILPAVINLFDVKKQGSQTILNWSTSAEELNRGFEIQRKVNGQFEAIGFVSSKATEGFSNQLQQYSFTDVEQFPGKTVYYRLKQMGYNGEEAFSEVRVLRNAGKLQTLIYPNPAAGNLHIVLPQDAGTNTIELTDYSGKRIRVWEKYNAPVLNISNLPKGFFTVFITNLQTGERTAEKVIVQ